MFKRTGPPQLYTGVFLLKDDDDTREFDFVDNGLFLAKNEAARDAMESGNFSVQPYRRAIVGDKYSYRTIWNAFRHNGRVIRLTERTLGFALFRLFHDKVGVARLHALQLVRLQNPVLRDFYEQMSSCLDRVLSNSHWIEYLRTEAYKKHPKQKLRINAYIRLAEEGRVDCIDDAFDCKFARINLKMLEFAKADMEKPARTTADLSAAASIRAGWIVDRLKESWSEPVNVLYTSSHTPIVYVKSPSMTLLSHLFTKMQTTSMFLYHSDDMSFSILLGNGESLYVNCDISACDASASRSVFDSLLTCVPDSHKIHMEKLIHQNTLPVHVGYGPRKMKFQPVDIFELSGSLLTTPANNVASQSIGYYLFEGFDFNVTRDEAIVAVKSRLHECGWSCSLQICTSFEELQFLKCSPGVSVYGNTVAYLNLGVILRAYGQKSYDLPGSGPLPPRIDSFMRSWVLGLRYAGNHRLMHWLRSRYSGGKEPVYNSGAVASLSDGVCEEICMHSICRRYHLDESQIDELIDILATAEVGYTLRCDASDAILQMDYGICNSAHHAGEK